MPPTPKVLSAFSLPFLAQIPGPRGTQRATGQVPGALGGDRPAAPGAGMGGGSASPPAWVPSSEPLGRVGGATQTPWLPVPYKRGWGRVGILEEECPAPVAWDSCCPLPPLAAKPPASGNQSQLGAGLESGELGLAGPLPCPSLPFQRSQITKGFLLYPQLTFTCPKS